MPRNFGGKAVASSAKGGVIRQGPFGTTYRDPFTSPNKARVEGGGGGGGGGRGRTFTPAQPSPEELERIRREEEERKERIRQEEIRVQTIQAQEAAQAQKQTLGGQLAQRKQSVIQSVKNLQTRGTFLQQRQQEILKNKLQNIPAEELRKRSLLSNNSIIGMSTSEGEEFSYVPTKKESKIAASQARQEFKNLPRRERLRLLGGSVLLGSVDVITLPVVGLSGGIGEYNKETRRYDFGKPTKGSIAESYSDKPGDIVRTTVAITGAVGLGGIASTSRPSKTTIGIARSSQREIDIAIVKDLERKPSRTFIIQRGRDAVFVSQRKTPFAEQNTFGQIRFSGEESEKFITRGISEVIIPKSKYSKDKQSFAGLGRTQLTNVQIGEAQGFKTKAILVTPKTEKIKDTLFLRGSGFSRNLNERIFVGVTSSRLTKLSGKQVGKGFGTYKGYALPESEEIGTTIIGSGRTSLKKSFRQLGQSSQDISFASQKSQLGQIAKNIQVQRSTQLIRPMALGVSTIKIQKPRQQQSYKTIQKTMLLQIPKENQRIALATSQITILRQKPTNKIAIAQVPILQQPTLQVPRLGSTLSSQTILPIPPTIIKYPQTRIPTGGLFIPPFPSLSEGYRAPKSFSARATRFNFQPSFTALVQNLRGGRQPRVIKGGFDPTVIRRIGARKRGRPKGSRKRKK